MAVEAVIQYIARILRTLPDSGVVLDYEPIMTEPEDVLDIFGGAQAINMWCVTAPITREVRQIGRYTTRYHTMKVVLFYRLGEAAISRPDAQALSEQAMAVFRPIESVGIPDIDDIGPMQRTSFNAARLAGTFDVWVIEHTIAVEEQTHWP